MLRGPTVHERSTTVDELRAFFRDEHVHLALLVDDGRLVGTVERADLAREVDGDAPADLIAGLDGRTVRPHVPLSDALEAITRTGRRRLAVTGDDSTLLGLLCLKATGRGFCSDADALSRGDARRFRR